MMLESRRSPANKYMDYDFKPSKPLSQDVEGEHAPGEGGLP
jgi:hypothetical protein